MTVKTKSGATYDDLVKVPDTFVAEIVEGDLFASPRPRGRHALAATVLAGELVPPFHHGRSPGPGGWWIVIEPELHLGEDILVPDLAGWRRERMPTLPETAYFEIAPDWVCEVLSPSTARIDRTDKLAIYAAHGVKHCWLVDPDARTLEVMALTGDKWLLAATFKDDDPVSAPPFEVHTFALDVLWPEAERAV